MSVSDVSRASTNVSKAVLSGELKRRFSSLDGSEACFGQSTGMLNGPIHGLRGCVRVGPEMVAWAVHVLVFLQCPHVPCGGQQDICTRNPSYRYADTCAVLLSFLGTKYVDWFAVSSLLIPDRVEPSNMLGSQRACAWEHW